MGEFLDFDKHDFDRQLRELRLRVERLEREMDRLIDAKKYGR